MASGDIAPTTPRQDTGLVLQEITISAAGFVRLIFSDGFGALRTAIVTNGNSTGFSYATGQATSVATPTGFTDLLAALTLTNAKRSAVVNAAISAGVIVVTGAVS